jgi:xanthine dehydrogenase large subunit
MRFVGKDIPHESAVQHATGSSLYIDDLPPFYGEVAVGFAGSPVAHGRIQNIDLTAARDLSGIIGVYTHRDVPGHNDYGPIVRDDRVLADSIVKFVGEPIVLLVGESRSAIETAKRLVMFDIEPLTPILSIDAAIAAQSFFGPPRVISCGNVDAAVDVAERVLEGCLTIGGQEHFYFEPQSALVCPEEGGGLTVYSSTQHTSEIQAVVAEVCGLPFHRVTCICRRMGGGFGGKETQAAQTAAMAAIATKLTGRPARAVLSRDDDMAITGKRHPFKSWYKAGFTHEGLITALVVNHYSDGGSTTDLSPSVLERAMLHTDNAYYLPNARISGQVCRTNFPSNTAFRGFGGPQGTAVGENVIEEIAFLVGRDPATVRRLNCYGAEGRNTTPYGQILQNNMLPALIDRVLDTSDYYSRRAAITKAHSKDNSALHGLAMTTVKFGISFTRETLNQANALVNIYLDGTVLVATGATEMGQGVNTRIRQLVADELGIDIAWVVIGPTNTDKSNNTSATAASCSTDLNGAAALDACVRLRQRLAQIAAKEFTATSAEPACSPDDVVFADGTAFDRRNDTRCIGWRELVQMAYVARVNLGERGFYITPGVTFDRDSGTGTPFLYYTNGAAVAEVRIDRLTGELQVERVDLLMDAGIPINPGIDRGQIVGGFMQGMGWVTTEELKYDAAGRLLSHSPTTYKIPNVSDLPAIFNVAYMPNPDSHVSLKRSKAVGEPPLLLGLCVWVAVKNALSYVAGAEVPKINLPATGEEILLRLTALENTSRVQRVEVT